MGIRSGITGDPGSAHWIPLDPLKDENPFGPHPAQFKPTTPHTPIPEELYVPTWPTPQPPLPPKGK